MADQEPVDLREARRGWVRLGIVACFMGVFIYTIHKYTGMEEGMIKPDVLYSYLTGIISSKIIDHYLNAKTDRML